MLNYSESGNRSQIHVAHATVLFEHAATLLGTAAARRVCGFLLSLVAVCGVVGCATAVAQAEPRQEASSSQFIRRQARPGDTLWSMAQEVTPRGGNVGETVNRIRRLNHLDTSELQVGQVIRVPRR